MLAPAVAAGMHPAPIREFALQSWPIMNIYARHGLIVRVAYLLVALLWWLVVTTTRLLGSRRGTVVLCYHGVSDRQRSGFIWQMNHLADRAIDAADLEAAPRQDAPCPRVLVTFDDAFANLLGNALPIMQQLEIPATVFAVPGNLAAPPSWPVPPGDTVTLERQERIMSSNDIRAAQSTLCRFGSHTLSHPDLTTLTSESLYEELVQSRIQLQRILQQNVEDIALPFGSYNRTVLAAARAAGYKRVFTLDACLRSVAPGVIGRFPMTPDVWRVEFRLTCAGAYAWLRPWRQLLRRLRRQRPVNPKKEPAFV
jgi:peptidoglycan/xylan/chitin deacetylase (PgdA/CDA1 family)